MYRTITKLGLTAACAIVLAACGFGAPSATPVPPTAGAGQQPTVAAEQPQPTQPVVVAQPTQPVAIAQPIIGFNPQSGGAGTEVEVFGSGYAPNTTVAVRLGLPDPLGEVLASAQVDATGRWNTRLVIPERLPSGEIITGEQMRLVAMDENNVALASAPFSFTAPVPRDEPAPAAAASDTVYNFLNAVLADPASPTTLDYLSADLRIAFGKGDMGIPSLLITHQPFTSFTIDSFLESQSPNMSYPVVQATLIYSEQPRSVAVRQFSMIQEDGAWRIGAVAGMEGQ